MGYIISTLVFGGIVWWFAVGPGRKAGDSLSPFMRKVVGLGAGALGVFLGLKGRWDFAIVLVSLSAWLLGFKLPSMFDPIGNARRSQIRTPAMLVTIDLGTGDVEAQIVAGRYEGRKLASIEGDDLIQLAKELVTVDPSGLNLILQDLDRRAPGWRQHVDINAQTGARDPRGASAEMREDEAYQVLGLEPGASEEAIRSAHRALISRLHPDRGGSTALAALVNRAKDVALASLRR
ncbi:DnaJ domain [Rhabdaerophilaceae bacterium]